MLDVGVVVEVTNCWIERDLEETIADGADTFEVVQVSDYVVGTVTATERAVPGDGDIPLARLITTICDAGFTGPFELEMLGPRVEDEGYGPAIARAVAALDEMLIAAATDRTDRFGVGRAAIRPRDAETIRCPYRG